MGESASTQTARAREIGAARALWELLTIPIFRFAPLPRLFAFALYAANLSSLFFLDTRYGQVVLAIIVAGLVVMVAIYRRMGFVRLLGVGHGLWPFMLVWLAFELRSVEPGSPLAIWIWSVLVVDSISVVLDILDVTRYLRGEREPYYQA